MDKIEEQFKKLPTWGKVAVAAIVGVIAFLAFKKMTSTSKANVAIPADKQNVTPFPVGSGGGGSDGSGGGVTVLPPTPQPFIDNGGGIPRTPQPNMWNGYGYGSWITNQAPYGAIVTGPNGPDGQLYGVQGLPGAYSYGTDPFGGPGGLILATPGTQSWQTIQDWANQAARGIQNGQAKTNSPVFSSAKANFSPTGTGFK